MRANPIPERCDGLRVPARLVARAHIDRFPDQSLRVTEVAAGREATLGAYTAVICDGGAYHYFHFMEAMIWLWVVQHAFLGGVTPARIVFTMPWDNTLQNRVQAGVLGALYPGVPLADPGGAWPASLDNVLIFDRAWAETRLNKIVEPCLGFARPFVMDMARRVRRAVGAFDGQRRSANFLHVTRSPPRFLLPSARDALVSLLRQRGAVSEVDFAGLPWDQQVRLSAAHDVMLGVQGNGLTNILWMRPGSLVLEFFPLGARHYDYQFYTELCGLAYFGFEGENVFPAFCRVGQPYGHHEKTNQAVASLNLSAIERMVEVWQHSTFADSAVCL
jgi:hypothetical protein